MAAARTGTFTIDSVILATMSTISIWEEKSCNAKGRELAGTAERILMEINQTMRKLLYVLVFIFSAYKREVIPL